MTPHAEKALNKKTWYSRNQGTVAMTDPASHQTEIQEVIAAQKNHSILRMVNQQTIHLADQMNAPKGAMAKKHPAAEDHLRQNLTPIVRHLMTALKEAMADHQGKRNHFRPKAGHLIQAVQRHLTTALKEVSVANHLAIKNHMRPKAGHPILAGQHHHLMSALKEVSIVNHQAKEDHLHQQVVRLIVADRPQTAR